MPITIDNRRQANITLSTGEVLKPGLNHDFPVEAIKANEKYLEALFNAEEITISGNLDAFEQESAVTFVVGDPVLDDQGEETFDEETGKRLVYGEDGEPVVEADQE